MSHRLVVAILCMAFWSTSAVVGLAAPVDAGAVAKARHALQETKSRHGADSRDAVLALANLGKQLLQDDDPSAALSCYRRGQSTLDDLSEGDTALRALLISGEGRALMDLGDYRQALALLTRAKAIQEIAPDVAPLDLAVTLAGLSEIRGEQGEYLRCLELDRRVVELRRANLPADSELLAFSLNGLAGTHGYLGQYQQALAIQEQVVDILTRRRAPDDSSLLLARLNLAINYIDLGDYADAMVICREVLAKQQATDGMDHVNTTWSLEALAACHTGLGEHEEALACYQASHRIGVATYGEHSLAIANTLVFEGESLMELGRLDEAAEVLTASLTIYETETERGGATSCELLQRLALVHQRAGDLDLADEYAQRAVAAAEAALGDQHPLTAEAYLARAFVARDRGASYLDDALLAEQISRRHLETTIRVLPESVAVAYAARRSSGLDLALASLADGERGERVARVWDAVVRSRGIVRDELVARNATLAKVTDPHIAALLDSSRTLRGQIAALGLAGGEADQPGLNRLHDALDDVERVLSCTSARVLVGAADARRVGLSAILSSLADGAALVAYVRYEGQNKHPHYLALVHGDRGTPVAIQLGPAAEVDALVEQWYEQVRFDGQVELADAGAVRGLTRLAISGAGRHQDYRDAARALAERIWDPVAPLVARSSRIFMVQAGALHLVSMPALVDRQGRYLVESEPLLHIVMTERSLASEVDRQVTGRGLLVVGGPDFGEAAAHGRRGLPEFSPLAGAAGEARQVVDIWQETHGDRPAEVALMLAEDATEQAVREGVIGRQVVHLATHGFFSHLSDDHAARPEVIAGLALTDANLQQPDQDAADDGILSSWEIAALDLSGVRWAVLSACDTGHGVADLRGDELFGLRRVFALAGARTVIASLWPVGDQSTERWMSELYRARWRDGMDTASAVKQASRTLLAARREAGQSDHPYHWAAFVAAGDWR